jgi:uncharacterized protein (TIRG00374 family)
MQQDNRPVRPIRRPTRLIKYPMLPSLVPETPSKMVEDDAEIDVAMQPTYLLDAIGNIPEHPSSMPMTPPYAFSKIPVTDADMRLDDEDISTTSTRHLMQLSGMVRAVRPPQSQYRPHSMGDNAGMGITEEEYWPHGIKRTGPLPVINLYGSEPFGRSMPFVAQPETPIPVIKQSRWKTVIGKPAFKVCIGLLAGIAMLFLVAQFVNVSETMHVLRQNLATPRGITLALLSGVAFLAAFGFRGYRWKLFLNPICELSAFKVMQIFLVGTFLNFLLPVRGGEVAKSLILKRIANVPISKSLPTIAMDKALDLMPALFIMAIVPFLGLDLDIKVWFILLLVGGLLIGLIFFVALAAWKRTLAISVLHRLIGVLPNPLASKIEGFASGFVDSLLMGASRPKIFLQAILLTAVAVFFEGMFAMLAFWTVGLQISFATAIFGYTLYNMFYILPTPPGQIGSNEVVGLLVFTGLLELPADKVTAMFVFAHPWAAIMMTAIGLASLSALGLNISTAMKVQAEAEVPRLPQRQSLIAKV